jgi:phosphotransferase system enzyme I (PtsI)
VKFAADVIGSGIAIGTAFMAQSEISEAGATRGSSADELGALGDARQTLRDEIDRAAEDAEGALFEILAAERTIVDDDAWWQIAACRVEEGATALGALDGVNALWSDALARVGGTEAEARVEVFASLVRRMKASLLRTPGASSLTGRVYVCESPGVLEILSAVERGAVALIARAIGPLGHASIVLRSLGLPSLRVDADTFSAVASESSVVVDAIRGELEIDPSPAELDSARRRASALERRATKLSARNVPAVEMRNGQRVHLFASIDSPKPSGAERFGDGIGLLRSELAFARSNSLDVGVQLTVYARWLRLVNPRRLVVRAFDADEDKPLPLPLRGSEPTWREVWRREDLPPALLAQIEALLRLGTEGDVRLLLPRTEDVESVLAAAEAMRRVARDLSHRDVPHRLVPVGAMIESQAAATIARDLANVTDFLAVGTSDLAASVLGFGRANLAANALSEPAVLRVLESVRRDVPAEREIWLCGAGLASGRALERALGLGYRAFAVDAASLDGAASRIAQLDPLEAAHCVRDLVR